MKLIIDIPEEVYKQIKDSSTIFRDDEKICYEAVQNGTPLEKHDEEVIKETVASVWGKPPCDDAISRKDALASIKNLYPDMPIVNIMGARQKWLEKYAPYFECENAIEQLPPVYPQNTEVLDKIRAEILEKCFDVPYKNQAFDYGLKIVKWSDVLDVIDKYRKGQTDADSD